MKNKFRIFIVALVACIFTLGSSAYAFTSTNYYDNQNISIGLESMGCGQLNITLNGDYTLNGVVQKSGANYILKVSGSQISLNGVVQNSISFIPIDTTNTIKIVSNYTRNYRGTLAFEIDSSSGTSKVLPVNTLYIEDYLKGVVGKEMSDYFPAEALKAQAVAARNYALANIGKHGANYSLCDTTHCQVYGGYDTSLTHVIAAVDATKGKVLLSGTSIVGAFYSANDGGFTEASGNVWNASLIYLKTKKDDFDVDCKWNSLYTTTTINTLLKMKTSLNIPINYTFVKIDLNSITKFESGRIKNISLIFKDQNGILYSRSYGKDSARTFLSLQSSMYDIAYNDVTDIYTFNGKGNGHGVGMSQVGAFNRAKAGQSFETILNFYYDGTTLLNAASSYTVTFNSQGGNDVSSKIANYNDVITTPTAPTKTGFTFGGWYKEAGCLNAWNFTSNNVTANTMLYAKWAINKYTVIFNSQGGNDVSSKIANYNDVITTPAAPMKAGYTFGGWYKEVGCLNAWNFTSNNVTANTTLYAKWTVVSSLGIIKNLKVASSSYNSINISFSTVSGASKYEVYRATSSSGPYTLISTITGASYNNIGLTTNSNYYYKVKAYKMVGTVKVYSGFSAIICAKPIPSMPKLLKAISSSYNSINISWIGGTGVTAYEVYRATTSAGVYKLISTTTAMKYNNTGLTTNTNYYYKVRAYRMVGPLKVYSYFLTTISAKPILSTPVGAKATRISSKSIKLTWNATPGANGYEVYRATSSTGAYSLVTKTSSLYYTNLALTTGKTYYYKMRSYQTVGKAMVYSNWTVVVYAKV
ncbi:MAG TPA: SpoIID/LytB domain-containing protein [Clostridium sp.]